MAIPESFLQELVEKNDIVDVVGEYVRLTKRSGSNQFGLCPFHSEKTPPASGLEPRRGEVFLLMSQQARGQACA